MWFTDDHCYQTNILKALALEFLCLAKFLLLLLVIILLNSNLYSTFIERITSLRKNKKGLSRLNHKV